MSEQEALADRDLTAPGEDQYDGGDGDPYVDEWDGDPFDPDYDFGQDFDRDYAAVRQRDGVPAGHSRSRAVWLFVLIGLAAAAMVVASVLLVTGRESGEIPTAPQLGTRTAGSTPSSPGAAPSVRESVSESTTATTPATSATTAATTSETESTTSGEPAAETDAPPEQAVQPEAPETSAAPTATQSRSPQGPKINVTRTPMSFAPGRG